MHRPEHLQAPQPGGSTEHGGRNVAAQFHASTFATIVAAVVLLFAVPFVLALISPS